MPKNRPKARVCLSCRTLFRGRPGSTCPGCGKVGSELVTGAKDTPDDEVGPAVSTIPTAPTPPPLPAFKAPKPGGGGLTPEMLAAGKAGLKQIGAVRFQPPPRPPKPLPGPAVSSLPLGVRVVVNAVTNPVVQGIRFARGCPRFNGLFYLPSQNLNLGGVLGRIAAGMINTTHGHYNSRYNNTGKDLPANVNPLRRSRIAYWEYGWLETVPETLWEKWALASGQPAPPAVRTRLAGFLREDAGKLDVSRLIVAETGELFYTPDHYETFYRYSPMLMQWTRYLAPFARYGDADWDESVYRIA